MSKHATFLTFVWTIVKEKAKGFCNILNVFAILFFIFLFFYYFCVFCRTGGDEKLIRIVKDNSRFGFSKEYISFRSLKELIEYHQKHPIINEKLTINLLYPYGNLTGEACDDQIFSQVQRSHVFTYPTYLSLSYPI